MIRKTAGALALLLFCGTAAAQKDGAGFYIGAHVGKSSADVCGPGLITCDDSATAYKGLVGYNIDRTWALELGYVDLGKVKTTGFGGSAEAHSTAFELVGIGALPVWDRLAVYGKLGVFGADTKVKSTVIGTTGDDSSTNVTFGGGVRFDFNRSFALRGEWQRYNDVSGDPIDFLSLGLLFRF